MAPLVSTFVHLAGSSGPQAIVTAHSNCYQLVIHNGKS